MKNPSFLSNACPNRILSLQSLSVSTNRVPAARHAMEILKLLSTIDVPISAARIQGELNLQFRPEGLGVVFAEQSDSTNHDNRNCQVEAFVRANFG